MLYWCSDKCLTVDSQTDRWTSSTHKPELLRQSDQCTISIREGNEFTPHIDTCVTILATRQRGLPRSSESSLAISNCASNVYGESWRLKIAMMRCVSGIGKRLYINCLTVFEIHKLLITNTLNQVLVTHCGEACVY